MNPLRSVENMQAAFATLHTIVPDMTDGSYLRSSGCMTCTRCQEAYGLKTIWDRDWDGLGGSHLELSIDGVERRLGGKCVTAIGRTQEEAWDNLLRALG